MYTIAVTFERLRDACIPDYLSRLGVYVLWDARAKARPTYIGEGNILRRLTDHVDRADRVFAHPWDGYIAALSGSTTGVHKFEGTVVERLLLDVASKTDRMPAANASPGSLFRVLALAEREALRVAVEGYDPLLPPSGARPLTRVKEIKVRLLKNGTISVSHDWRYRRLRATII